MFHYTHLNGLTLNGISDKISARKNLNIGDYVAYKPDVYIHAQKDLKGECSDYYSTPTTKTYIPISKNPTGNTLDIIQTDYSIEVSANYFNDENFYKLIFTADNLPNEHSSTSDYEFDTPYFPDYWLATRSTRNSIYDYAEFGLRSIKSNISSSLLGSQFSSAILFSSNGEENSAFLAVRPVVHLSSSVKLSEEGGSRNNPKTLSK